jgi:hypothetical protein
MGEGGIDGHHAQDVDGVLYLTPKAPRGHSLPQARTALVPGSFSKVVEERKPSPLRSGCPRLEMRFETQTALALVAAFDGLTPKTIRYS